MCGNVICGRFDPSKPFFTARGSFWTNCTTELLATTTEADRQARTRNRCNGEGYESVALIALRVGEDRLGLLQLNDHRKDRFTAERIALWERLAGYLAVALAKTLAEEHLRATLESIGDGFFACDADWCFVLRQRPGRTHSGNSPRGRARQKPLGRVPRHVGHRSGTRVPPCRGGRIQGFRELL